MAKLTIQRSFSKKVQLRQFEPIDVFCGAEVELPNTDEASYTVWSKRLDDFCREEVEKTLAEIRPPLKPAVAKSKSEKKDISKLNAELDAGNEYPN